MNYIITKGGYGRLARYRNGPGAVVRTAHPGTFEVCQLASTQHVHNLLQYSVAPGIRYVKVDQQLPTWVRAVTPRGTAPFVQLVEFEDGDLMIVRLLRDWKEAEQSRVVQLKPRLWYLERSTLDVATPTILNRNLELVAQSLVNHFAVPLHQETTALCHALESVPETTIGDFQSFARFRFGLSSELALVVLIRLLFSRQLFLRLAAAPLGDATPVRWGAAGVGYFPPMRTTKRPYSKEGA